MGHQPALPLLGGSVVSLVLLESFSSKRLEMPKPIREFSWPPTLVMGRDLRVTDSINALNFFLSIAI